MKRAFEWSAEQLAEAYHGGEVSPVDVVRSVFDRIDAWEPQIHALYLNDLDAALAAARHSEKRWREGRPLSSLDGVPITIKEAFDVAGLKTTSSHPPLAGNVARADASVVARLRAAGAVILGKTNVPELCADFQTNSPIFGTTLNPWDQRRTPGGSTRPAAWRSRP